MNVLDNGRFIPGEVYTFSYNSPLPNRRARVIRDEKEKISVTIKPERIKEISEYFQQLNLPEKYLESQDSGEINGSNAPWNFLIRCYDVEGVELVDPSTNPECRIAIYGGPVLTEKGKTVWHWIPLIAQINKAKMDDNLLVQL